MLKRCALAFFGFRPLLLWGVYVPVAMPASKREYFMFSMNGDVCLWCECYVVGYLAGMAVSHCLLLGQTEQDGTHRDDETEDTGDRRHISVASTLVQTLRA